MNGRTWTDSLSILFTDYCDRCSAVNLEVQKPLINAQCDPKFFSVARMFQVQYLLQLIRRPILKTN